MSNGTNAIVGELVGIAIRDIAIPEIAAFIRRRHEETGKIPTNEEIIKHHQDVTQKNIEVGLKFLEATKPK